MAERVPMPKWGLTMEEGTIVEWEVGVGDRIERGQRLATVESEKNEMDLESPDEGYLAEFLISDGDTVAVGEEIAVIAADESELSDLRGSSAG